MAAVRHLGFVLRVLGPLHEEYLVVFVTAQNLVVIGAVISIVMQILMFCMLSLKMPIHAPKLGLLGILPPKWGAV